MNVQKKFKESFYNQLINSNITTKEFCNKKNLQYHEVLNILKKSNWSNKFSCEEEIIIQVIENWLTEKQIEKVSREIFDVKEVQLKFKEYKQKDDIINMIMRKLEIESKKITV